MMILMNSMARHLPHVIIISMRLLVLSLVYIGLILLLVCGSSVHSLFRESSSWDLKFIPVSITSSPLFHTRL